MVSFLKRRKSTIAAQEKKQQQQQQQQLLQAPPVPQSHGQARQARSGKTDLAMPDLRFSTLDLDAHIQSVGSGGGGGSSSSSKDRPKSRLSIFSFGNARSTDDLQKAHQLAAAERSSNAERQKQRGGSGKQHNTLPRSFQGPPPPPPENGSDRRPSAAQGPTQPGRSPLPHKSPARASSAVPLSDANGASMPRNDERQRGIPHTAAKPEMRRALNSSTNVTNGLVEHVQRQPNNPVLFASSPSAQSNAQAVAKSSVPPSALRPALISSRSVGEGSSASTNTADKRSGSDDLNESEDGGHSSSFVTSDEQASEGRADPPSPHRIRPARDEEREQRVQSRLSMHLDDEVRLQDAARSIASSEQHAVRVPAVALASASANSHQRNDSNASKLSTFSAMLMASQPGGAADRSVEQEEKAAEEERQHQRRMQYYRTGKGQAVEQSMLARFNQNDDWSETAPTQPAAKAEAVKRVRESMPVTPPRTRLVQASLRCRGDGWECLGVGDVRPVDTHWRTIKETIEVAHIKQKRSRQTEERQDDEESLVDGGLQEEELHEEEEIEYKQEEVETHFNDLFELLFTSTTPDVIARLLSHLDIGDIKSLRQVSSAVRLSVGAQRETLLVHYLSPIGYRTWTHVRGTASAYRARLAGQLPVNANKDPCPLSLQDLEAFLIGQDLLSEYAIVGLEYALNPKAMDPGIALLAKATTRAYNRVLTRLRLQPVFKQPSSSSPAKKISQSTLTASPSHVQTTISRHNSYYDARRAADTSVASFNTLPPLPTQTPPSSQSPITPSGSFPPSPMDLSPAPSTPQPVPSEPEKTKLVSPWKPGRAAHFRIWVPARDQSGWLSDEELAECEQELYKSGIWQHLKRGDIVWDTAVGDQMNEGKYVFDGHYLRDLSYAFDVCGHLPSWMNVVMFSPSYWHNIIRSSMPQPVVYMDVTPWREQILNSLRLVQDQVDTFSGHGARYRIAKWLYRSAANVTHGQIISRMNGGLEIVDEGWHGRIVIEMDGTAEMAKMLVNRCAGPDASPQQKAALLASVMGDATAAKKANSVQDTNGLANLGHPLAYNKFSTTKGASAAGAANRTKEIQTAPWAIMRERSRPGLIWIRPLGEREKVVAAAALYK